MYETCFGQNTCWFKHSGPSLTPFLTYVGTWYSPVHTHPSREASSYSHRGRKKLFSNYIRLNRSQALNKKKHSQRFNYQGFNRMSVKGSFLYVHTLAKDTL